MTTNDPSRVLRSGLPCLSWMAGLALCTLLGAAAHPAAAQPPGPPPGGPDAGAPLPPRPSVAALHIDAPIKVDGELDDAAWQTAPKATGFVQHEPNPGQPASDDTEVQIAYTNSTLYVAIRAKITQGRLVAEEMQRDSELFRDDSVIVLLDTFHDHRNAYWFETNANGARTDALLTDEGRDFNVQWDGIWRSVGRRTADGWTAELEIPFSTLRFDPNNDVWGFNVRRLIRSRNEEVFWASIPLDANLFRVSLAGTLTGIRGPEPGLNLRLKPFAVGKSTDAAAGFPDQEDEDKIDLGMDVKWGITRQLTLDLTYNTDFAEVEVDDQQVNLTRFSLFFPEKREFFLENAGIFEFGFNPPGVPYLKPFFSRRIGIGPFGDPVQIDWGARLTGRAGPWSIGLLDAQTARTDESFPFPFEIPQNNWGVARIKRNVGQRSTIGMIFTDRDANGSFGPGFNDSNRVFGLDANFNPTRNLNLAGFWTKSDDSLPTGGQDWAGGARALWQGPVWSGGLDVMEIGEAYNPEAGFLLRSGIRRYYPQVSFRPRPQIAGVRNLIFDLVSDVVTDLDDRLETLTLSANLFGVQLQSDDQYILYADHTKDRVPGPFAIAPDVVIPAGDYEFSDVGVSFNTNTGRPFALSGQVQRGSYYDGDLTSGAATLTWRGNRHLRTDTTWVYNDADLPFGKFTANVVRQRVGISFTPDLATNLFAQYNDLAELVSLNLRFGWMYKPGADIFLVLNQNWNAPSLSDLSTQDRQVILKVTYLLEL